MTFGEMFAAVALFGAYAAAGIRLWKHDRAEAKQQRVTEVMAEVPEKDRERIHQVLTDAGTH